MSSPVIQGWCPGALQPMLAEDGWVVRIRPPLGRLTQTQARGVAALAGRHAQGTLEITGRANVQLRGIRNVDYPVLLSGLQALGLVDADVRAESRRNLLLTPFWQAGDGTTEVAHALALALGAPQAPDLPAKFGFALDCGDTPVLRASPADIRIERCDAGFLVYADGSTTGALAHLDDVVAHAMALAQWFVEAGGLATPRKRMASLVASQAQPHRFTSLPVPAAAAQHLAPLGRVPLGYLAAVQFGQLPATTLAALAELAHLRLTPWRSVLLEGVDAIPAMPDLITRADDPRLRVHACTGAPGCGQAAGATRPLARVLAASLPADRTLHVSGCAKGCAHPAAALTVVAAANGYNLIQHGSAAAPPDWVGLTPAALATQIEKLAHATPL